MSDWEDEVNNSAQVRLIIAKYLEEIPHFFFYHMLSLSPPYSLSILFRLLLSKNLPSPTMTMPGTRTVTAVRVRPAVVASVGLALAVEAGLVAQTVPEVVDSGLEEALEDLAEAVE